MQPLAIMFFLILAELAIGGLLLAVLVDYQGIATKGFLGLSAATYFVIGLAAAWARQQVIPGASQGGLGVDAAWRGVEGWAFTAFLIATAIYALLMFADDPRWRRVAGVIAAAAGGTALVASGFTYQLPQPSAIATIASIVTGAIVIGSAMSGMILGHWYLVTPGLSAAPLRNMTLVLLAALLLQAILIPIWLVTGGSAAGGPGAAAMVAGIYSIPFWLRVLVGIVLPAVIAGMTLHCCRIRSLQSATGLLYVAVALVLAGEIASKLLLVLAGVPV